jgi:hypothetical protein
MNYNDLEITLDPTKCHVFRNGELSVSTKQIAEQINIIYKLLHGGNTRKNIINQEVINIALEYIDNHIIPAGQFHIECLPGDPAMTIENIFVDNTLFGLIIKYMPVSIQPHILQAKKKCGLVEDINNK